MAIKKTKGVKAVIEPTPDEPLNVDLPAAELKIENVWIDALRPFQKNSRTHTKEQIKALADMIKEVGYTAPIIIDESQQILSGHARVEACRLLGYNQVPAVSIAGLSDKDKIAIHVGDNSLAINGAGWDMDELKRQIDDLIRLDFPTDLLNFTPEFLQGLMTPEPEPEEAEAPPEGLPAVVCRDGEVWMLGLHELRIDGSENCYAADKAIEVFQKVSGKMAILDGDDRHYWLVKKERLGE